MEITDFFLDPENIYISSRFMAMRALGVEIKCRRCGSELSKSNQKNFVAGKRTHCKNCEWFGNWRDNTPLASSTLNDAQFIALFYKFYIPDNPPNIAEALGISASTVRSWKSIIKLLSVGEKE